MSLRAHPRTVPWSARFIFITGMLLTTVLACLTEFYRLQRAFSDELSNTTHFIETRVDSFEIALESFANFLAITPDMSDAEIRGYTEGVRKIFPELYMFEIATRVAREDRQGFEEMMRNKSYPEFKIHGFDYSDSRQVFSIEDQPYYFVIRFIDPESTSNRAVLGLDLVNTSDDLVASMMAAFSAQRPLASSPFRLLEGGKGYVMYRPVISRAHPVAPATNDRMEFAMLVIRANDLLPQWIKDDNDYQVSLSYATSNDRQVSGTLIQADSAASNSGLYRFSETVQIHNQSQPFRLTLEQAIGLTSPNWVFILGCLLAGFSVSLYLSLRVHRAHQQALREQNEKKKLYRLANYDALTGLPNTNLLMDRAEQAVLRAERSKATVAICYMDVNKFKEVNDKLGHDGGDQLLIQIADRLQHALRHEDTVARIHGDEFVILLPQIEGLHALEKVQEKMLTIFEKPFDIAGHSLTLSASTGSASYPEDGLSLEELLSKSDKRMYLHKEQLNGTRASG